MFMLEVSGMIEERFEYSLAKYFHLMTHHPITYLIG
jgi:hypothetical protein